jgi:hypothetical protein
MSAQAPNFLSLCFGVEGGSAEEGCGRERRRRDAGKGDQNQVNQKGTSPSPTFPYKIIKEKVKQNDFPTPAKNCL